MATIKAADESAEHYEFDADVSRVFKLLAERVYSSKELFLRELVSNSSDAITKLLEKSNELKKEGIDVPFLKELKIRIIPDKETKTLTIQDNGIGMSKADLISFLGSIASSGTEKFRETSGEGDKLIGQFGLGFYAAFLVAERVTVLTRTARDAGFRWTSEGNVSYTIEPCDIPEMGTTIILKLKDGEEEYLEESKLTNLVKKYSGYIRYPVVLITREEPKEENKEVKENEVEEIKTEEGEAEKETNTEKTSAEPVIKEKVLNEVLSIWDRNMKDIPKDELVRFYKSLSNDYEEYSHAQMWNFEGLLNIKILLFIPKKSQPNFFAKPSTESTNVSLFSANVLVCDKLSREVVPEWMDFVVGAISSPDFPINISREFLQGNSAINLIKNKLPKCILEMVRDISYDEDKFSTFTDEFSRYIKLAVRSTHDTLQENFAALLRYEPSIEIDGSRKPISFDKYLQNVPESQSKIHVLTALSREELNSSLYLKTFKEGPVLLMPAADDEVLLQGFTTYKGKTIQMISKEGADEEVKEIPEEFKGLEEFIKKQLEEKVERVVFSSRLEEFNIPAMLFSTKFAVSGTMERILKAQPKSEKDIFLQMMLKGKKILELNTAHRMVEMLKELHEKGDLEAAKEQLQFVFDAARMGCGYLIEDQAKFMDKIFALLATKQ